MTRLTTALAQEFKIVRAGVRGKRYQTMLPMNVCLDVGDYIASSNGLFFAIVQGDGVFRIYRGSDVDSHQGTLWDSARPGTGGRFFALVQTDGNFCIYRGDGLARNEGWQWGTQMTAEGGQFYALMQDDGVFCIRRGLDPANDQGVVWQTGVADRVARIDAISAIDYCLGAAKLVQSRPSDLYRETVRNAEARVQSSLIAGSVTVSDTAAWSDELEGEVDMAASFNTVVPVMQGGAVVLSQETSQPFARNAAITTAKTWGFNAPAAVPAKSSMTCLVAATRSTIAVPFTLTGVFTLASGNQVSGTLDGLYTGSNCHDLAVTLTTYELNPHESQSVTQALAPVPAASVATPHARQVGAYV